MKNNTYIFEKGSNIMTTGNLMTEGSRYTYKEGGRIGKIIFEKLIPDLEYLRLQINFYIVGRTIEVSHLKDFSGGYMGMWRIYDESFYDKNVDDYHTYEKKEEPPVFTPSITKAAFVESLTVNQKELLLSHFDTIYECPILGEHELNIAYLAWLYGNGHVMQSEEFTMTNMDVEFNEEDYEIGFEDEDNQGGVNLELTRSFYDLDKVYAIISDIQLG